MPQTYDFITQKSSRSKFISTSSNSHFKTWENIVGRSRSFWEYFYPQLQAHFPSQLGAVSLETFYRSINRVSRSLIRTDADEITYNLHVMIRFDLEIDPRLENSSKY